MAKVTVMITQTYDTSNFVDDGAPEDIDIDDVIELAYNRFAEDVEFMVRYSELDNNIVHVVEE